MKDFSYITNSHPSFVENLYHQYLDNPQSVDPELKKFFEGFDFAVSSLNGTGVARAEKPGEAGADGAALSKEFGVFQLIEAYRKKAHLIAKTNPIRPRKDRKANLQLEHFGLSETDLENRFAAGSFIGMPRARLKEIIERMQSIYAASVGIEYTYINDAERLQWLETAVEQRLWKPLSLDQQKRILEKLNEGVIFEKFLHTKYIGQKRFSLEGGETAIPALDAIIDTAAKDGVQEVVIGMAHRGRLNVLANVLGKTYEQIFREFEASSVDTTMGSGDVKYHLGFGSEVETFSGKKIHLKLSPNPSHLEAVDPVVLGFARAKADVVYNHDYDKVLPILIHGDASLAGQGVVYEIVQMSYLKGYYTGGTIHLVINNQIGFTTDFDDARSADYC
ncbi:MAG TPA: thiamine pyrophosphate-dependent enzyme, partial [Chitinophagaceae bacterium]